MKILRRIPARSLQIPSAVAAIGIFDGVHRGHQGILRMAVERARALGGTPVAITFHPHPLKILRPARHKGDGGQAHVPPLLISLEQRLRLISACGVRVALVIPFTRSFSRWSPEAFVERLLVQRLRVREMVVGSGFRFGTRRSGTTQTLKALSRRYGFKTTVVPPVRMEGERISSARIRQLIAHSQFRKALRFLGRPATVRGRVVRGAKRGKSLGFPTANLAVEAGVLPPRGVYAVHARVNDGVFDGMANLGFRPTFEKKVEGGRWKVEGTAFPSTFDLRPSTSKLQAPSSRPRPILEVHLFDCRQSLYGRRLEVALIHRLRAERRFPTSEALRRQLLRDAARARQILGREVPSQAVVGQFE